MKNNVRKEILKKRTRALEVRARSLNRIILLGECDKEREKASAELSLVIAILNARGVKDIYGRTR